MSVQKARTEEAQPLSKKAEGLVLSDHHAPGDLPEPGGGPIQSLLAGLTIDKRNDRSAAPRRSSAPGVRPTPFIPSNGMIGRASLPAANQSINGGVASSSESPINAAVSAADAKRGDDRVENPDLLGTFRQCMTEPSQLFIETMARQMQRVHVASASFFIPRRYASTKRAGRRYLGLARNTNVGYSAGSGPPLNSSIV